MASTLVNTLYPPLVDTFMPAFLQTEKARINFSISPYNTKNSIDYIHVSLTDLTSNQSVLKPSYEATPEETPSALTFRTIYKARTEFSPKVLNDILIIPFSRAKEDKTTGLYYIELSADMLKGNLSKFPNNKYFKAQLRFDNSASAQSSETENVVAPINTDYLIDGRKYFSEWSSICLIKAIAEPRFVIRGFERADSDKDYIKSFAQGIISLSGYLEFLQEQEDPIEEENLISYEVWLKDKKDNIIDYTGVLYPSGINKDEIDCMLNADNTTPGEEYHIIIKGLTKNYYEPQAKYTISIADYEGDYTFEPTVSLSEDMEDGCVYVHVKVDADESMQTSSAPGRMYVRRASSIDNFKKWELLTIVDQASSTEVDEVIVDKTVGSLASYKYAVQYQFYKGTWSQTVYSGIIYPTFYDILLSRQDVQLAIRYNGQLTSLKPVVNRSKFDTLGGKYPKFAENAQLNYKQYSLSGLISAEGDFNRKFISEKDKKYKTDMEKYTEAFGDTNMIRNDSLPEEKDSVVKRYHDSCPHENWYWERQFREEVVQWLNDGEAKLFRSMPEGNMIVMITDINLTPNQNIGRLLYNFTATMYEIGDGYSLEKLDEAGIITVPDVNSQDLSDPNKILRRKVTSLRQIEFIDGSCDSSKYVYDAFDGFTNMINSEYSGASNGKQIYEGTLNLSNIKIEFTSRPQWLDESGKAIKIINTQVQGTPAYYGYSIKISSDSGAAPLFIGSNGIYIIPKELDLNTLQIMNGDSALITAIVSYEEDAISEKIPSLFYKEDTLIGQHSGVFNCDEWIGNTVRSKYKIEIYGQNGLSMEQKMKNWKNLSLEVTPYSVVEIVFNDTTKAEEITVGRSGVYVLEPLCYVDDLRFIGRRMFKHNTLFSQLAPWEFTNEENAEGKTGRNHVYEKNGKFVILFNGKEYPFIYENETTGIAKIPVEGYVNYLGDIVRSEYN